MNSNRIKLKVKIVNCFAETDGSDVYWFVDEEGTEYSWQTKKIFNKVSGYPENYFFNISATYLGIGRSGKICLKNVRVLE